MVTPALFTSTSIRPSAASASSARRALPLAGDVDACGDRVGPLRDDRCSDGGGAFGVQVGADDRRAFLCEAERCLAADADAAPVTTAFLPASLTGEGRRAAYAGMVSFRRWARCIRIMPITANTLRQIRTNRPSAAT